jgi:DNA-binding NarL/FixJ family response regulator
VYEDIMVAGEATNRTSLINVLQSVPCDVLVAGLTTPQTAGTIEDGVRFVRRIRRDWPAVQVVVLTGLTNAAILRSVVADGAVGIFDRHRRKKRGRSRVKDWRHPSMKESLLASRSIAPGYAEIDSKLRN